MPTITIRDVPQDVRNKLGARAASQGRSLQEFMLRAITDMATRPAVSDLVEQVRQRKALTPRNIGRDQIIADRDADRR